MHSNGHAVCVAINDNNRAWYEMLVPFLLSLRQTGYDGTVAVIGYGLSEHKRRILESQSVDVIEASSAHALPVGRFIEAADYCARNPQITRLALYDADIWFCAPSFDLFSQIGDDRLYACPDPLFCTFVVTPLIGERRDHHWRLVVDEVAHEANSNTDSSGAASSPVRRTAASSTASRPTRTPRATARGCGRNSRGCSLRARSSAARRARSGSCCSRA